MQQVQNSTPIEAAAGVQPPASALRLLGPPRQVSRPRRLVEQLLVLGALTLGFLVAPTLQGINLVADQSTGTSASLRAADAAASAEVVRLTGGR